MWLIYYIDININIIKHSLLFLPMSFLDLNDDVKSIISKHLSTDMNISKMVMSKHYDLQKMLFGEILFDEE